MILGGHLITRPAPALPGGVRISCSICGCGVRRDHVPGSEDCLMGADERLHSIRN